MRATKILATLGPASDSPSRIRELLRAGSNGFRLNFSHGSDEEHRATLRRVHAALGPGSDPAAIVADLQGPKIRIGDLTEPQIRLEEGSSFRLDSSSRAGNARGVSVSLPDLTAAVAPGDPLLLGDGSVELEVEHVDGTAVLTRVVHGGVLSPHAGLFLPRAKLRTEILGPKDRADLALALEEGIDFVAVSFVRAAEDIEVVRRAIARKSDASPPGIIAKIERREALENIGGILDAADAIMVARGDLGIEVPLERLALEQKSLIARANAAGRTVIVATQMLLSMVSSPRPTRAEATDVANAVLDGADAVMLSEESAVGQYPVACVDWLDRIARSTEPALDRNRFRARGPNDAAEAAVAASAVRLAEETRARAIVTPTHSGRTARLIARHRPSAPIWALSANPSVRRRLALAWGVRSFPAPAHQSLLDLRARAVALARAERVDPSGTLVLTAGYPVEGRPTNLVTSVEIRSNPVRRPGGGRGGSSRARSAARRR